LIAVVSGRVKDMVLVYLSAALQKVRPLRAPMLVVAVSALLALLFTVATRPAEPPRPAGEAAMQLMDTEHDLVAASIRDMLAADAAKQVAEARSRADMRRLAVAEAASPAIADRSVTPAAEKAVATVRPAPRPDPAIQPPLQLQAVAAARPERRRPVVERARAVLATVEEIPQLLRSGIENVADWAASPARVLSRLPERRFL
jgi:hypothetical protein